MFINYKKLINGIPHLTALHNDGLFLPICRYIKLEGLTRGFYVYGQAVYTDLHVSVVQRPTLITLYLRPDLQ